MRFSANFLTAALSAETGWEKHTVITMLTRLEAKGAVRHEAGRVLLEVSDSGPGLSEAVRATLLAGEPETRWASLGQSFGGFLTLTTLSLFPAGVYHCTTLPQKAPV